MAAVTSLMRAQQVLMARLNDLLRPHGLTFPRYEALMLLSFTRAGALPLGKIGERLQVHRTSVTNIIDKLEADGLVRRVPHAEDRRATLAEITDAGPRQRQGGHRGAQRRVLRHRLAPAARPRAPHDDPSWTEARRGRLHPVASRPPQIRGLPTISTPMAASTPTVPTTEAQWREAYALGHERDAPFATLSGLPIKPLYTEADLPGRPARSACRAAIRSRAASTRRCTGAGCGRCASSPASAPPRRPTSASATCSTTGRRASRPPSTCPR